MVYTKQSILYDIYNRLGDFILKVSLVTIGVVRMFSYIYISSGNFAFL